MKKWTAITLTACLLTVFNPIGFDSVQADLFVRKGQAEQQKSDKKSFFSKIFGWGKSPAAQQDSQDTSAQRITGRPTEQTQSYTRTKKDIAPIDLSAVKFYKSARNIDTDLLQISGPGPQNTTELVQLAAALKTPQMASLLKLRRENRESIRQAQKQYEYNRNRMARLKNTTKSTQAQTQKAAPVQATPTKRIFIPQNQRQKPAKVFTDFR